MLGKSKMLRMLARLLLMCTIIVFIGYSLSTRMYSEHPAFNNPNLKYILQWTNSSTEPFKFMGKGQDIFLHYHCPVNSCYITSNKSFMNRLTDFSAILFSGPELNRTDTTLPGSRLSFQKYVYVSMESPAYYSIYDEKYDNFFNWTLTYKLNSDIYFGYIAFKNKDGDVIGPKEIIHWNKVEEMKPIDSVLKNELRHKKRLAAWFVSNCRALSKREAYVEAMRLELAKYNQVNLTVDVYGKCRRNKCPRNNTKRCELLIKKVYYFYLSFENSIYDDYVTEKLLTALRNNAVPVVFGGANYSRFMPDGAYLNAREASPRDLVQQMIDIINNSTKYYDFFRWRNYYSYHSIYESIQTNPYCKLCSKLHEKTPNMRKLSYYTTFRKWWNNPIPES